ncbi:MAG: replicative DNA helicase, partial [Candidatus Nomurabacteria bacterium]|nr:replicative DNA helicase [Candidatus Nomurabacteria bacterium]
DNQSDGNDLVKIGEILGDTFERFEKLANNKGALRGLKTGFPNLDKKTAGLQKSDLVILGARPAMGKTTFVTNLAYNVANYNKKTVLFFSLEMSKDQLIERMLANAAAIDSWNIRSGNLTSDDFTRLAEAMGEMSESPIQFYDRGGLTITGLRTMIRRAARESEIGLVVIDYLQLMDDPVGARTGNDVQKYSNISRGLKLIAREFDIPVVALSQLSRDVAKDSRQSKLPQLADLRGSGSIEQDADIVMFLHREDYYNEDTDRKNITDLIIAKHRNGPVGRLELYFHPELLKFVALDRERQEE